METGFKEAAVGWAKMEKVDIQREVVVCEACGENNDASQHSCEVSACLDAIYKGVDGMRGGRDVRKSWKAHAWPLSSFNEQEVINHWRFQSQKILWSGLYLSKFTLTRVCVCVWGGGLESENCEMNW